MDSHRPGSAVLPLALLLLGMNPLARADGVCTERAATPAEAKSYADAYALFLRVAPKAPDGWTSTDSPATGAVPKLCQEFANEPIRRQFDRNFDLERGRQERENEALQAYTDMAKAQQATVAANQAKLDAIDAQVNALNLKVQQAAVAQRFEEVDTLSRQMDALMQQRSALMGIDQSDAQTKQIEARQTHDTHASFALRFETPNRETRDGTPYRTSAGQGLVTTYDDRAGNPIADVRIYFGGASQQARVVVTGDPARVRELMDAADLQAIAAFR
jgi:hypothetical protein